MHELKIPEPLNRLMLDMWQDMEQRQRERVEELAKADPHKYRKSLVFPKGSKLRWLYYKPLKDGRGSTIKYCHTTVRNVAGYFLSFREVRYKDGSGKRDMWLASRSKKRIIAATLKRWEAHNQRRSPARPGI